MNAFASTIFPSDIACMPANKFLRSQIGNMIIRVIFERKGVLYMIIPFHPNKSLPKHYPKYLQGH